MKKRSLLARRVARIALTAILVGSVAGCGNSPGMSPTPDPSAAPGEAFQLNLAPANLGCDAMGVPYRSATIRFAPAGPQQVSAVTDPGAILKTVWSEGFVGGPHDDPSILDPEGRVVARDGEVVIIPVGAWPRLNGYFVCPSPDALFILLTDPA
jgi:hypothetical protein